MSNDSGGTALRPPSTRSIGTEMPTWRVDAAPVLVRMTRLGWRESHRFEGAGRRPRPAATRAAQRSPRPSSSRAADHRCPGSSREDRTRPSSPTSRGPGPTRESFVVERGDEPSRDGPRGRGGLLPGHREMGGTAGGVDAVDPGLRGPQWRTAASRSASATPSRPAIPSERVDDHEQPSVVASLVEAMCRGTTHGASNPCGRSQTLLS